MANNLIYPNDFLNKRRRIRKNTCFVIMPFGKKTDDIYKTIKKATSYSHVSCERSDEMKKSSPFINKILSSINTSYFLIVDISGLNANVFYELGIAHTLRSISKVLILKDKNTVCPSDIRHLNYFSYDKGNYDELFNHVVNFIKNNSDLDDLGDLLLLLNLIKNEVDLAEILNDLQTYFSDYLFTLISLLNNTTEEIFEDDIHGLLKKIKNRIFSFTEQDKYSIKNFYLDLIKHLLYKLADNYDISDDVSNYFCKINEENKFLLETQSEIAITLLQIKHYDSVFQWIKDSLMKRFPAAVDIIKYKILIGLINSRLPETSVFLVKNIDDNINNLDSKPIRSLVEHSLNLCKEKEIRIAIPVAMKYIQTTVDEYIFRSAVDLITQLGTMQQIVEMLKISSMRNNFIKNSGFLNDHIENANRIVKSAKNS